MIRICTQAFYSCRTTHTKLPLSEGKKGNKRWPFPSFRKICPPSRSTRWSENATRASNFLKAISHEGRLMILCHLVSGEKSVTELEELLSARQAAVSQQLSRLRLEGTGDAPTRRQGDLLSFGR